MDLRSFIAESNRIEGIFREVTPQEISETEQFLAIDVLKVPTLQHLVSVYQPGAELRDREGMNVRVGSHIAPPGGPEIRSQLSDLLVRAETSNDPFRLHVEYETLHPFMDGNGRSGRAIWLWQMLRLGDPLAGLGFLHAFYYQTLSAQRQ